MEARDEIIMNLFGLKSIDKN